MNEVIESQKQARNSNFHFIVPVWGKEYTKLFTDICLPMLLTPGNIGFFKGDESALFVIVTTIRDSMAIRKSKSFRDLERLIMVRFHLMDGEMNYPTVHRTMTRFYREAMESEDVKKGVTSYVFLTPDSFWSDGTFKRLFDLKENGHKVVMIAGLRTCMEDMIPILKERITDVERKGVLDNRELVGIALENLHPMALALDFLNPDGFLNAWPSNIYWKVDDGLMVAHCFHMHPLLVKSRQSRLKVGTTIDGDMLEKLNYPLEQYYVVQDSDECIGLELTKKKNSWGQTLSAPSLKAIRSFAANHCSNIHWHCFSHRVIYHMDEKCSPEVARLVSMVTKEAWRVRQYSRIAYPLKIHSKLSAGKSFIRKIHSKLSAGKSFIKKCVFLPLRIVRKFISI